MQRSCNPAWWRALAGVLATAATLTLPVAPGSATVAGAEVVVSIGHGEFKPRKVEVKVGDTVTWVHEDGEDPHSVTADDGSFDSSPGCSEAEPEECLRGGDRFRHPFSEAGRYPYYSRTEGGPGGKGASGVVIVEP